MHPLIVFFVLVCLIVDTTPPTIVCPGNIVENVQPGVSGASVTWTAVTASDASGVESLVSNFASGTFFTADATPSTITYTATDIYGNVASCSFTVSVVTGMKLLTDTSLGPTSHEVAHIDHQRVLHKAFN